MEEEERGTEHLAGYWVAGNCCIPAVARAAAVVARLWHQVCQESRLGRLPDRRGSFYSRRNLHRGQPFSEVADDRLEVLSLLGEALLDKGHLLLEALAIGSKVLLAQGDGCLTLGEHDVLFHLLLVQTKLVFDLTFPLLEAFLTLSFLDLQYRDLFSKLFHLAAQVCDNCSKRLSFSREEHVGYSVGMVIADGCSRTRMIAASTCFGSELS